MSEQNEMTETVQAVRLPLWKNCLEKMRSEGMTFGTFWTADFFERELRCKLGSSEFDFSMLSISQDIKWSGEGYVLKSERYGQVWRIAEAKEIEDIAKGVDAAVKRGLRYAVELREATLNNTKAVLDDEQRKRLIADKEKAAWRLLMVSKAGTIKKLISQKSPNLLK